MSKIRLSIRLIKEGYNDDGEIIFLKEDTENDGSSEESKKDVDGMIHDYGLTECTDRTGIPENGTLYFYTPKKECCTSDASKLFPDVKEDYFRIYPSFRAVYLTRVDINGMTRIFALSFGNPRGLFKDEAIEPQFGLKIMLNSIAEDGIRKISKKSIGTNRKISDEQLPEAAKIFDFGFDSETDLIRSVSGKSADGRFGGSMLNGGEAFSLSVDVGDGIEKLDGLLMECYEVYASSAYVNKFPWFDNIKRVDDKNLNESLDNFLIEKIKNGDYKGMSLVAPEVIKWEDVNGFVYDGEKFEERHFGLNINEAVNALRASGPLSTKRKPVDIDISFFKKNHVSAVSESETPPEHKWSIYKCLCAEIRNDAVGKEGVFCLSDGVWYRIEENYYKQVTSEYSCITSCKDKFIKYGCSDSEGAYNVSLKESISDSAVCLDDKILVSVNGHGERVEPCDVLCRNRLIFVKRYGGSSTMSYVFNQAHIAGRAWTDPRFLGKLKDGMKKHNISIPDYLGNNEFKPSEYRIIVGIIGSRERVGELPDIPFLSKAVACYVSDDLKKYGYGFEIKDIPL